MTKFILLFHILGTTEKAQADFSVPNSATELIEQLTLDGYKMYQYILSDYTHNMSCEEMNEMNISFTKFQREKKTCFGLSKKNVEDLLIEPKKGFFYPYEYGSYLYVFSKNKINQIDFKKWLDKEMPNNYSDFDNTFAGFNSEKINLINNEDYLIVTCHDHQEQLGISGNSRVISELTDKLKELKLDEFEINNL